MKMPGIFIIGFCFVLLSNPVSVLEASLEFHQDFQPYKVRLQDDDQPYRTSYHFQPRRNWLNDPNGPMLYKGVYHLFYQYNPYGAVFGDKMVWAHSVSYDLINWMHLDDALRPSDPFDINSCWSGSATILPGNKPVIMYTGIDANKRQVQNLAMPKNLSDPFLEEWVKFPNNPVLIPPDGVEVNNFRDPTTSWQGADDKWKVIVGSYSKSRGMAILYESRDFINWTMYREPLYSSERSGMWECPDFYPVSVNGTNGVDTSVLSSGVKHVMKASFNSHDYYTIGTYLPEKEKYIPDADFTGTSKDLRYDYGKFYASKTFFDSSKNRRILWGWINESDSTDDDIEKGWSGLQSIPRQIWLHSNGKQLVQWPVEEINELHSTKVGIINKKLDGESVFEVQGIDGSQADVDLTFELSDLEDAETFDAAWVDNDPQVACSNADAQVKGKIGPFGLIVFATKELKEQTTIFFRIFRGQNGYKVLMCSDNTRSSLRNEIDKTTYGEFVDLDPQNEIISLRGLVDHSIIESFGGGGRTCITSRVYPTLAIHKEAHIYVFNNGTLDVTVSELNAWSMNKARINLEESLSYKASH